MKKFDYLYKIIDVALFAISSLPIFYIASFFLQDIGSKFSFFLTFIPLYLSFVGLFYLYISYHFCFFFVSKDKQKKSFIGHGIALSALGFLIVLIDVIYLSNGTYPSFLINRASKIYPLDSFLLGFLFCLVGGFYSFLGWRKKETNLGINVGKRTWYFSTLKIIFGLISSFFFGDLLFSFVTFDRSFSNFFGTFSVYLLMAFLPFLVIFYSCYLSGKENELLIKDGEKVSFILTIVGLVLSSYFLIAYSIKPSFFSESLVASFPLIFMASKFIGPILLVVLSIVYPLASFLYYFKKRKDILKTSENSLNKAINN